MKKESGSDARKFVLKLLIKMSGNSAFSNILLDEALQRCKLSSQDKKFASAMFYGVIERQLTLDAVIKKYSSRPMNKLSDETREILRMGVYQLLYMDSVPESAAVNESVILAADNKNPAIKGFVNALLRGFIRDGKEIPTGENEFDNLSLKYSCPVWLVKKWVSEYGKHTALIMLETSMGRAPVTVRVNTTRISSDELINEFAKEDIVAVKSETLENCLEIKTGASVATSIAYNNGYFHVQDISSQLCCKALGAEENDIVLDICGAPGGKTFTIAELMNNKGRIYAFDLHEKRAQLIWKGAKKLGLDCISAGVNNGKEFNEKIPVADKILCDVPCSGLGVIRRKPEIKYKDGNDFEKLPEIQYQILKTSSEYLKVGGELVYSTCTLSRAENDEVIDKFLEENSSFEKVNILCDMGKPFGDYKATIIPDVCNSDGFFISKIRRVK